MQQRTMVKTAQRQTASDPSCFAYLTVEVQVKRTKCMYYQNLYLGGERGSGGDAICIPSPLRTIFAIIQMFWRDSLMIPPSSIIQLQISLIISTNRNNLSICGNVCACVYGCQSLSKAPKYTIFSQFSDCAKSSKNR